MSSRLNDPKYLVGYWPLNSHSDDVSGQGNNGTFTAEAYADGQFGNTVGAFDGSTTLVTVPNNAVLNITDNITLSCWFKATAIPASFIGIMAKKEANLYTSEGYQLSIDNSGDLRMSVGDGTNGDHATNPVGSSAGEWVHVVGTYDSSSAIILYVDGKIAIENTFLTTSAIGTTTNDLLLGDWTAQTNFNGNIGESRIYNTVLTQDEVLELFHQTKPKQNKVDQPINQVPDQSDSSLVGAWLNKRTKGNANDYSVKGNNGTATDVVFDKVGATFTTAGAKIDVGADPTGTTALTLSAWVNPTSQEGSARIWDNGDLFIISVATNTLRVSSDGTTNFDGASNAIKNDAWNHVVFTRDVTGANSNLYINGELSGAADRDSGTPSTTTNLFIGNRSAGDRTWQGQIRGANAYSKVQTVDWVKAEFEAGVPDSSLTFHTKDGLTDLSVNKDAITKIDKPILGNRMKFDGTDDALNIDSALTPLASTTTGTWMAWIKPTDATPAADEYLINFGDTDVTERISLLINTAGNLQAINIDAGTVQWNVDADNSNFLDNTWTHVAIVQNGTEPVFYENGVLVATTFTTSTDKTSWFSDLAGLDNGRIGDRDDSNLGDRNFFDGSIDDVQLFNTNKDAGFIKNHYEQTRKYY